MVKSTAFFVLKINASAYIINMKLSFSELKKREVINVVDAKNLGSIIDLELDFPKGILVSITVQGKKTCKLLSFFNRNKLVIPRASIVKIGGDVILVKVNCGSVCEESVDIETSKPKPKDSCAPPCHNPCAPPLADVNKLIDDDYDY